MPNIALWNDVKNRIHERLLSSEWHADQLCQLVKINAASVFDVSSTYSPEGKELPGIVHTLSGSLTDQRLLDVLMDIAPVPVVYESITTGANGYFSLSERRIVIKTGLSEVQTAKTLLHETAHAWLHAKGAEQEKTDQQTREVQVLPPHGT